MDPRRRLERPYIGESMSAAVQRPRTARIAARADVEDRPDPVKPHREPLALKIRGSTLRVTPGPNAPQLIRLVRYPFSVVPARNQKVPLETVRIEAREKFVRESGLRAAIAETVRPPRTRATSRVRPTDRPRLRALGWLTQDPEGS